MYFGSAKHTQKCSASFIEVDQCEVKRSKSVKYLGIIMDEQLKFHEHINAKCKLAALNLHRIKSIRKHLSVESAKQLASTFVLSHFDYCNALLYGLPAVTRNKFQRLQNRTAKMVLRRRYCDSSTQALYELHWLPISYRVQFKIIVLVFKCLQNKAPKYLIGLLEIKTFTHNTRLSQNGIQLLVPKTKKRTFADRSFSISGPKLWNHLPAEFRAC